MFYLLIRSGRKNRHKVVAFKEETGFAQEDEGIERGAGRRKLVLSDTDEENTAKDKGRYLKNIYFNK